MAASRCERQLDGGGSSDLDLTVDRDGATLQADELLDAGETEAGARVVLGKSAAFTTRAVAES